MKRFVTPVSTILIVVAVLYASCSSVLAQSATEKSFLSMYFTDEELEVVSATRSLTSISRVAENITVITASDIELMNAHTVAEVLNTVTGFGVELSGGPGLISAGFIQGSESRHVMVMIDGVVLNFLGSNQADLGMIPVQNIRKIELVKGPASSAWGSALGGVVNIITKSGNSSEQGGILSASYGKKNAGDFRAEARGKQDRLGYYVTAGRLQSDGLTPHFSVSDNNAYTKLTYDLTDKTYVLFAVGYAKNSRGNGLDVVNDLSFDNITEISYSTLALTSALTRDFELNVSARSIQQDFTTRVNNTSSGEGLLTLKDTDKGYGSSVKLTWKNTINTVVIGADSDDKTFKSDSIAEGKKGIKRSALFANDTLTLGDLSIIPGIRYDKTSTNGEFTSPSFGVTYTIANNTILRAYVARGFSLPTLAETFSDGVSYDPNPGLKVETVWSQQAGVETAALKYVWIKASVFKNDVRDGIAQEYTSPTTFTYVNIGRERLQGTEFEIKTAPVYNTYITAGAEFIDAKDLQSGQKIQNIPTRVYDIGVHYSNEAAFKALLVGRSIDWNAQPSYNGKYRDFIFDLHLIKKVCQRKTTSLDAFFDVHNIFNGSSYLADIFLNPRQWVEGGLRFIF